VVDGFVEGAGRVLEEEGLLLARAVLGVCGEVGGC
jgi:hypothetical protein